HAAEKALRAYLSGRTEGFLFRPDFGPSKPRVTWGCPNKSIPAVYWRAFWAEYDANGKGRSRNRWIGNKDGISSAQARAALEKFVKGKNLSPPEIDRPLSVRYVARI